MIEKLIDSFQAKLSKWHTDDNTIAGSDSGSSSSDDESTAVVVDDNNNNDNDDRFISSSEIEIREQEEGELITAYRLLLLKHYATHMSSLLSSNDIHINSVSTSKPNLQSVLLVLESYLIGTPVERLHMHMRLVARDNSYNQDELLQCFYAALTPEIETAEYALNKQVCMYVIYYCCYYYNYYY